MRLEEIFQEMKNRDSSEELTKRRYACASCGTTWTELVGMVIGHRDGKEDLCLRIGMESESCQVCRLKARECQECGSKDVYELRFQEKISEVPLSFKSIRTIDGMTHLTGHNHSLKKRRTKNEC